MARSMKVISTNPGASQPRRESWAELMNSSLAKYPSVTVCARFLTHHFSPNIAGRPTPQSLISYGTNALLSSFLARPCDQTYTGCTQDYKKMFSRNKMDQRESVWLFVSFQQSLLLKGRKPFTPELAEAPPRCHH